jgi:hypothetical protein
LTDQLARLRRPALPLLLLVGFFLLLIRVGLEQAPDEEVADVAIDVVGPPQTVFDWSSDACEPQHVPDLPVRAFRDYRGRVQLILPHYVNRRMIGPSLDAVQVDCTVTMRSTRDADPAAFDDKEWIASVFTQDGRDVAALVHEEYQGSEHPGRCPSRVYERCWYNAITFARSADGGRSFRQPLLPDRLIASSPHRYTPDVGPVGLFAPSNIVRNPDDGLYYAIVQTIQPEDETRGSCVIRTSNPASPSSWRAWDGEGFELEFVDPYESAVTPEACEPVATAQISEMRESLTYNTYLDRFVLVGLSTARPLTGREPVTGVYFSLSSDLIDWTPRKLVMEIEAKQSFECGDPDPIAYPSLLDPSSRSRTFETTGRHPFLYYTQFHYSDCAQTIDRDLVRIPLEVSARDARS